MGLFSRGSQAAAAPVAVRFGEGKGDVEVVGESYRRDEIAALFHHWGLSAGGVKNCSAVLVREPNNPHDRNAVKVMVDNFHVGYIEAELATGFSAAIRRMPAGAYAYTPARAWASNDDGTWRARITLRFSGGMDKELDYGEERRARGRETEARKAGTVAGQHWTAYKPVIQELKKQERYVEALEHLSQCFDAAVRESVVADQVPNPWPTEQAAMIRRKMRDAAGELSALERYASACGSRELPEKISGKLMAARVANGGIV